METTPNGQDGRHVRPHVVSASELVTEHAPTLNPSSEDYHAKSRVWACQTKRNIVTCVNVELTVTTLSGLSGRAARIPVDPESWFGVELVPILLRPTVDLNAQDWGDPCKALSVTSWTAQLTGTTPSGRTGPLVQRPVAKEPKQGLAPAPTRPRSMVVETALK